MLAISLWAKLRSGKHRCRISLCPILTRGILVSTRKTNNSIISFLTALILTAVAASAQPYAYVSNLSGNNVSIVNTATHAVVGTVPVPAGPTGLAVTPDGSAVYVASQSKNCVS